MTVVVADHTGALARTLTAAIRCRSADEALDLLRRHRGDRLLVHGDLPSEDGLALAGRAQALRVTVVLALADPDADRLAAALRTGVRVVVDVAAPAGLLVTAFEAAARGDLLVAPALRGALDLLLEGGGADPFGRLSVREREVLCHLAGGADQARVATRLGLARKTVRHHVASARRKLGVADEAAAVRIARRGGLRLGGPGRPPEKIRVRP
ncbi:LuxR C-terminal-related transcriptional regulator [Conexibacter sp. SYSU D00693]|uniref:response regulator transcription factor n=1 Tax=Conexibacter sp. SYSU D00693 TaxID=2812560 RepID=UPI00196A93F9|nr:LuxR C-terminal-related transcriptional regulator [Conexibacter sp. SYSU D00693]